MNRHTNKTELRELTLRGFIIGALITVVFTASNVYLGLKVGLTFASSIPAAVISMAVLRLFPHSNILENNMVQTQASAAGTLSAVIFVIPGLLMIGYWQSFPFWQTLLICASGGMLGVVFTIPLRHAMVVKSTLPYPEGVAAAEILKAGSPGFEDDIDMAADVKKQVAKKQTTTKQVARKNEAHNHKSKHSSHKSHEKPVKTDAKANDGGFSDILFGSAVAAIVSFATSGLRILSDGASYWFTYGRSVFQVPVGFSLALLSAGYLVGIVGGMAILVGSIIAWGIAIPILTAERAMAGGISYADFAMGIWVKDVRFIGAGTIAIAALWTLFILINPIVDGVKRSMQMMSSGKDGNNKKIPRTEQDLSPKVIGLISVVMFVVLIATFHSFVADSGLSSGIAWLLVFSTVIFAYVIGFLVAAACGYMAGLIGSSASPISGIAIIAVTAISLLLLFIGNLTGILDTEAGTSFATALAIFTTSAVLAIAAISNDNLQDLKTGYLIKATPWRQQVALLVGCVVGAAVIAPVLDLLYNAYGFSGATPRPDMDPSQVLAAPQATLMTTIAKGIFSHQLEWTMIFIGLGVGAAVIALDKVLESVGSKFRIPALAVGMGIYLPPIITAPLIIGSIISWLVAQRVKKQARAHVADFDTYYKPVERKGTLLASGLIVGESLIGVAMAAIIVTSISSGGSDAPLAITSWLSSQFGESTALVMDLAGLTVFVLCCILFVRYTLRALRRSVK